MSYQLIITEKPNASKKIAEALDNGKPIKENVNQVPYYKVTHKNTDIIVACAVGHLYGLTNTDKKAQIPIFDIEWAPTSEISKGAQYSKKYLDVIKKLAKGAKEFIVATDYDIEGEVIGLNIVRFACKQKDAQRMKYSTLTKEDLVEAYENRSKTLDWGQAEAGETRHKLDWYYGINTSRALTKSIQATGHFKLMSTGRVQGPALKLVVTREKEIKAFKPEPFWQLELKATKKGEKEEIIALHKEEKIFNKDVADSIYKKIKDEKQVTVIDTKKKDFIQAPPIPFDLTSLQLEAHKTLGISPKQTLEIAQELYIAGFISYPRTSSQQLDPKLGFKKILTAISQNPDFKNEAEFLLKKPKLVPNNGKKTDPAHPAIYPTGIKPRLEDRPKKLYELIVRRFLATFGDPAKRQTLTLELDCKQEVFKTSGTTTLEPGWHTLYGRFAIFKEVQLPTLDKGEKLDIKKISKLDRETSPPKRFTEASVIKELEKQNLGTKATRASIVETLYDRGYIDGKAIEATELGMRTCDTLEKYCPTILDQELTRHFEDDMELIRQRKSTEEKTLKEAQKVVTGIVEQFKSHQQSVGNELFTANSETRNVMSYVGKCMACNQGELHIRPGKFGKFIACNRYPDCKTTFGLPSNAQAKPAKKECEQCKFPMLLVLKKNKRPQEICLNIDCPSKVESDKLKEAIKKIEAGEKTKCDRCDKGTFAVRKSLYGTFIACDQYPKCRNMLSLR